jgi:nitroreductase
MKFNLSEISELIKSRRTIYPEQFSERLVQRDQIERIINNALWAPTHGNTQPWRFQVFTDSSREKLSDFLSTWYMENTPEAQFNPQKFQKLQTRPLLSSVVIAIVMERDPKEKIMELEEIEAVACAVQNMHLTCTAYGLGGFWSTPKAIYSPQMNDFLEIGEKDKCLGLFYIGYPNIEWPKAHRKPIEYVTRWRQD